MSFKIDSELSEDQIESDVASYLGYVTPFWSKRFRLISVDEQKTGADKLFKRFIPLYLQFKVSHGLDPEGSILNRYMNKPLAKIISYRRTNGLTGDPILYFELRKLAQTATDFQHNVLRKTHKPPYTYAFYIAPLTLRLKEYEKLMNRDWHHRFYRYDPFDIHENDLHDSATGKSMMLGNNPFLRHHISIPPHIDVNTHKHHYSYSINGSDIAWHGGDVLSGDYRFSNQLNLVFSQAYKNKDSGFYLRDFIRSIDELRLEGFPGLHDENNNSEERLRNHVFEFSRYLKFNYNISLYFLTIDNP